MSYLELASPEAGPDSAFALPLPRAKFIASCLDRHGRLKWTDEADNLVTTVGANSVGDVYLRAQAQITTWYVGLKGAGTPSNADTASSHGSWTEITTAYDESARRTLTLAAFSGRAANNSASVCVFTFNTTATVAGFFTISVSTKGGTTGTLLNVADFSSGSKTTANGDVINLTVSYSL